MKETPSPLRRRRSCSSPIVGSVSPVNQAKVNPFQGIEAKSESLNANRPAAISGAIRNARNPSMHSR